MKSQEPSPADLAAIEDEWPLIAAELDLLDVQLAIIGGTGRVDELEVRRLRHARNAVIRKSLAYYLHRSATARRAA